MTTHQAGTAFVTGATSLVGIELIQRLVARGVHVAALAESVEAAHQLRRAGAFPVRGDLLVPGLWQDEASAHWVFHLAPSAPMATRARLWSVVDHRAATRAAMDRHLFDAVASGVTRRIVYVGDARRYRPTGSRSITEDELQLVDGEPVVASTLDPVDGYIIAGLPIVTAVAGCVYGNDSWFRKRVAERVLRGQRVIEFGKTGPWVSPIHVRDCARALVHLAEHGEAGNRYFVADNQPVPHHDFARVFARLAGRPLSVWRLPAAAARFVRERPFADDIRANAAFSNIRLRGIGFQCRFPTLESGLADVLAALQEP